MKDKKIISRIFSVMLDSFHSKRNGEILSSCILHESN